MKVLKALSTPLLLGILVTTCPLAARAASVELRAVERSQEPGRWDLWIVSDVPIGDGAVGIVGATELTVNSGVEDQYYSCAFQDCGTQGPGAQGSDVVAGAIYVSWAGRSATTAFGAGPGPQRMGDFAAPGAIGLTFGGVASLFGSPEDAPLSNLVTFERIPASAIALAPELRETPVEGDGFAAYKVKVSPGAEKFHKLGPIEVADTIAAGAYDVIKPTSLALAATIGGEGGAEPATGLLEYAVKAHKGTPRFAPSEDAPLQHACGELAVRLDKPTSLLVPARIDGLGDDRGEAGAYLCYQARLTGGSTLPKGIQIEAGDGFQSRRYDLDKLARICRPAAVSGDPAWLSGPGRGKPVPLEGLAMNPSQGRLACYRARPSRTHVEQATCGPIDPSDRGERIDPAQERHARRTGLSTRTVFGEVQLDTVKEIELCLRDASRS